MKGDSTPVFEGSAQVSMRGTVRGSPEGPILWKSTQLPAGNQGTVP